MTIGNVKGIIANLVIVEVNGPVLQNEICMIKHPEADLMAEVIRVDGSSVYTQVFESTRGLKTGVVLQVHLPWFENCPSAPLSRHHPASKLRE